MKRHLTICACLLFATAASAQLIQQQPPSMPPSTLGVCRDKVAVTAFSLKPGAPLANESVTATMSIKNLCSSGTLNVPWDIDRNSAMVGSGTVSIGAGETVNVSAMWVATPGSHHWYGDADMNNTLSDGNRTNNIPVSIDINVAPIIETQRLSMPRAKAAGASFSTSMATSNSCTMSVEEQSYPAASGAGAPDILITLKCPDAANTGNAFMFNEPMGGSNFTLKNGWKFKSCSTSIFPNQARGSYWQSGPPLADQSRATMWAVLRANATKTEFILLTCDIYGPQGTDPYRCTSGVDCATGLPN